MARIYIAHAITGDGTRPREENVQSYLRAVRWAIREGFAVVTWVHHYILEAHNLMTLEPEEWLEIDKRLIDGAEVLLVASDPAKSKGVAVELAHARAERIPILYVDTRAPEKHWVTQPDNPWEVR